MQEQPTADCVLVQRIAGGDEQALRELSRRHDRTVYAVAYGLVSDTAEADQVVADTFAQARRLSGSYDRARGAVPTWLTTIARACVLNVLWRRAQPAASGGLSRSKTQVQGVRGDRV